MDIMVKTHIPLSDRCPHENHLNYGNFQNHLNIGNSHDHLNDGNSSEDSLDLNSGSNSDNQYGESYITGFTTPEAQVADMLKQYNLFHIHTSTEISFRHPASSNKNTITKTKSFSHSSLSSLNSFTPPGSNLSNTNTNSKSDAFFIKENILMKDNESYIPKNVIVDGDCDAHFYTIVSEFSFDHRPFSTRQLANISSIIFRISGVGHYCNISDQRLQDFCIEVERNYRLVPYHNFRHGFTVMQITHILLQRIPSSQGLPDLYRHSMLFAALCHDIAHDGRTNSFHVATKSKLALAYNNSSVLENMHAAKTIALVRQFQLFQRTDHELKQNIENQIKLMILFTDMKMHHSLLHDVQAAKENNKNHVDNLLLAKMIIHSADISNPILTTDLSKYWANKVLEEFTAQIQDEERLGIQQSTFLKATPYSYEEAKLHFGFIQNFVQPAWTELSTLLPWTIPLDSCVQNIQMNHSFWQDQMASKQPNPAIDHENEKQLLNSTNDETIHYQQHQNPRQNFTSTISSSSSFYTADNSILADDIDRIATLNNLTREVQELWGE